MGWLVLIAGLVIVLVVIAGRKKRATARRRGGISLSEDGWLRIDAIDWFGSYVASPDGRYILSWRDSFMGTRGSKTVRRSGAYLLLEGQTVRLQGRMPRPSAGAVSNVGTFALNDWTFSDKLTSVFKVIAASGAVLLSFRTKAIMDSCGISADGRFACCQTCHSDFDAHSGMLFFFEVPSGQLLWKKVPETGWAESYRFDVAERVLYLQYEDLGEYRYRFTGECVDVERWRAEDRQLENPSGYDLVDMAKRKLKALGDAAGPPGDYVEPRELLRRALKAEISPNTKARVHRHLGEIAEALSEVDQAISEYEEALKLNERVGVKRRLKKLHKARGQQDPS
ncbi:MAG: tetratricopeptide repeat protein [Planctomycetota bacterium]